MTLLVFRSVRHDLRARLCRAALAALLVGNVLTVPCWGVAPVAAASIESGISALSEEGPSEPAGVPSPADAAQSEPAEPSAPVPPGSAEGPAVDPPPAVDAGPPSDPPTTDSARRPEAAAQPPPQGSTHSPPPIASQTTLYVVKAGDTLNSISRRSSVGVDALVAANKLASPDAIREGQRLVIPVVAAASAESPTPVQPAPETQPEKPPAIPISLFPTAPPVLQTIGQPSVAVSTRRLPKLVWPIERKPPRIDVTQSFQPAHRAIDIGAPEKTPIRAAASGVVKLVEKTDTGYGSVLVIDHGDDITTWYAHLSTFTVGKGDRVESGQKIGEVGNTGRSSGPHLHFELRIKNTPLNPRLALP